MNDAASVKEKHDLGPATICPRCKHRSTPFEYGYSCNNCCAGFIARSATVTDHPLVRETPIAGRYEIRRRSKPNIRVWISLSLFLAIGLLASTRAFAGATWRGNWEVALCVGAFVAGYAGWLVRDHLGRIYVQVDEAGLTATVSVLGLTRTARVHRRDIAGIWIRRNSGDEDESADYDLVVDEGAHRSRTLFRGVERLGPLVLLAERLAEHLQVPADTRATDL